MGLADEFTVEMALFITGNPEAGQILFLMTRQNAFITPLSMESASVSPYDEGMYTACLCHAFP